MTSNTTFVDQGTLGSFAMGEFVQGAVAPSTPWPGLSEPVRLKINPRLAIALIASGVFQIVTVDFAERVDEAKWHQAWSEPVRQKIGLKPHLQQSFTADTSPFPASQNMAWLSPFGEPVRFKQGLRADLQQTFTVDADIVPGSGEGLQGWLMAFGEPVRSLPGLSARYQQTLAYHPRILPTPSVTVTWNSTETGVDVALFAINVYDAASTVTIGQGAKVSIIELTPGGQPVAGGNDPVSIRES